MGQVISWYFVIDTLNLVGYEEVEHEPEDETGDPEELLYLE